ncbi:hypothetical protein IJ670_08830 [bacterium]|nr:hypothetical protein [bacterium]
MDKYKPKDLLPHKAPMVLIDEIVDFSIEKRSLKSKATIKENDIFYDEKIKGTTSLIGLEFMAQTVGCLAQIVKKYSTPKIGFLLGTRMYNNLLEVFPLNSTYTIEVREEYTDCNISSFSCFIYDNDKEVASATITAYQSDNIEEMIKERSK